MNKLPKNAQAPEDMTATAHLIMRQFKIQVWQEEDGSAYYWHEQERLYRVMQLNVQVDVVKALAPTFCRKAQIDGQNAAYLWFSSLEKINGYFNQYNQEV